MAGTSSSGGLTVRSDVYTVGTSLKELLDVAEAHETDCVQMAHRYPVLERLLDRAVRGQVHFR
jgi:hypothetical protein